ncbi:hypothetical protein K437DRAFT_188728 [Tilletiaria anomala UBC 951]|uniref:C2H2-type domain-containing protein n=1 Tax=Tilletiaria anomala (strain ATCC 24038 / CBS 436.72 / UBC 951) TaxID=1037660 RepID=A0A066VFL6_TILAU|nr:uncharacterized protein K437DRAFT_188728 [Tilletiaria anomala UBC 951]KDN40532.1 hypothetical protein K437DRAFT_188728 [Tilletiaria anomala UBC 951]
MPAHATASSSASPSTSLSSFGSRRSFSNAHSIKNDRTRSHVCLTCGMSFNRLLHLQRHEYRHSDSRPFVCTQCPKSFTRQDSLVRHSRLHMRGLGGSEFPQKAMKVCMKCTKTSKCKRCTTVGKPSKAQQGKAPSKKVANAAQKAVMKAAALTIPASPEDDDAYHQPSLQQQQQRSPSLASIAPSDFSWSSSMQLPSLVGCSRSGTAMAPDTAASPSAWTSWSSGGPESDINTPVSATCSWDMPAIQRMRSQSNATTASSADVASSLFSSFADEDCAAALLSPLCEFAPSMHDSQQQHEQQLKLAMPESILEKQDSALTLHSTLSSWPMSFESTVTGAVSATAHVPMMTSHTGATGFLLDLTLQDFQWSSCLDLGSVDTPGAYFDAGRSVHDPCTAMEVNMLASHFGGGSSMFRG